jgi:hypothetical protein
MRKGLGLIFLAVILAVLVFQFIGGERAGESIVLEEVISPDGEIEGVLQRPRVRASEAAGFQDAFAEHGSGASGGRMTRNAEDDGEFFFRKMAAYDSIAAMVDDVGVSAVLSRPELASDIWLIADLCANLEQMPAGVAPDQVPFCGGFASVLDRFAQGEFKAEVPLGHLGDQAAGINEDRGGPAVVEFLLSEIRATRSLIHTISAATNLSLLRASDRIELLENLPDGTFEEHQMAANAAARLFYCNRHGGCTIEHPLTQMFCAMFGCEEFVSSLEVAIRRTQSQREMEIMDAYLAMYYRGG